jgi:anti-anti-sigma factor
MIVSPGLLSPETRTAPHATQVDASGEWVVAELGGEIDSAAERAVGRMLVDALGPHQANLVVDLSAVRFLDSAGFRALLRARDRAVRLGGRMVIACPRGPVHERLVMLNAGQEMPIVPDVSTVTGGDRDRAF